MVAHDLHPEYLSTKYALELRRRASWSGCSTTTRTSRPAWPTTARRARSSAWRSTGSGYGTDGTLWGGEFLVADLAGFERAGHLAPVPMPGGAAAIRRAVADGGRLPGRRVRRRGARRLAVRAQRRRAGTPWWRWPAAGSNAPLTSSAGRLFDAVAALLGVRDAVSYEGQAAIELEQRADPAERGAYPVAARRTATVHAAGRRPGPRPSSTDLPPAVGPAVVAARFHNGLAAVVVARLRAAARDAPACRTVALSGGVFQNLLLLDRAVDRPASRRGFRVLTHHRVPPNDGGISLGQAAVAAARDRAARS